MSICQRLDNAKHLLQLKKDLKSWESMFLRNHGCKPSKEDIKNSPAEIKDAYRDYQRIKSVLSNSSEVENSASNQSITETFNMSTDNRRPSDKVSAPLKPNNEVFGSHLNKKSSEKLPKQKIGVSRPQITRRWVKGRGFMKEEVKEKKEQEESAGRDVSEMTQGPAEEEEEREEEGGVVDIGSLGSVNVRDTSRPASLPPNRSLAYEDDGIEDITLTLPGSCMILRPKLRHGHGISELWLNSVQSQLGSNQSSQDNSKSVLQVSTKIGSKKTQTCFEYLETQYQHHQTPSQTISTTTNKGEETERNSSFSASSKSGNPYLKMQQASSNLTVSICGSSDDEGSRCFSPNPSTSSDSECSNQSISPMDELDTEQHQDDDKEEEEIEDIFDVYKGTEEEETATQNELNYDGALSPFQEEHSYTTSYLGEEECHEPFYKKKRRKVLLDRVINELSDEVEPTEIEHTLTAISTADPLDSDPGPSHEICSTQEPKPKGGKNTAVSDNFVRLNMKVKRFSRKPNRITGSRYKRQQWKQRERRKGLSGGVWSRGGTTCFKCGKSGHWAHNCSNSGGFKNLGKFDGQDVCYSEDQGGVFEEGENPHLLEQMGGSCVFPTVEEAAQMMNLDSMEVSTTGSTADQALYRSVEPFLELEDGKVVKSAPEEVVACLNRLGYREFRAGQEAAVLQILSGISTILVQPTGSGKSLCYQLPAFCYAQRSPSCITLVISPLISLMQDQVHNFPAGLSGACIHTGLSQQQRERIITDVTAGKVNVLLISPETLVGGASGNGWSFLSASKLPPIAFACIDEAHCLSEWSHNFRPSYLRLCKILRQTLGVECILGLTATASSSTIDDMADLLNVKREHIITGSAVPDNLILSVSCEDNREQALVDLLCSPPFSSCESIIVYCTRQQTTERVAQLLRTSLQFVEDDNGISSELDTEPTVKSICRSKRGAGKGGCGRGTSKRRKVSWSAECYHAGLSPAQRKRNQSDFMAGRLRILVCTVAFGMGLDKPDVRAVIHYNMPKSFESYVQEIGRAGRDRDPAYCHVLIDNEGSDLLELRRHIYANGMDHLSVKQLVQKALPTLCCHSDVTHDQTHTEVVVCCGHEVAIPIEPLVQSLDTKEEVLLTLLCYLELQNRINLFNPINDTCCVRSYGGMEQLRGLSRRIPALAMAIDLEKQRAGTVTDSSSVVSSVTEVANALHCDSPTIQQTLRDLQYSNNNTTISNTVTAAGSNTSSSTSSNVMVEFSNLSFHLKTTRCFSNEEKDTICQQLMDKVKQREHREIERLYQLYGVMKHISLAGRGSNSSLKDFLHLYFADKLTPMYFQSVGIDSHLMLNQPLSERRLAQVKVDIRTLISTHDDRVFTGRAVARILQGIASPCYPAEVWGRRVFHWRKYLDIEFNTLCKIATDEIINT